ncbi:MAG: hypothetical protein KBG28_26300 [Kofleriaceae bacterium]|nr:hypothetical protein [Kofleriaceae bacterium]
MNRASLGLGLLVLSCGGGPPSSTLPVGAPAGLEPAAVASAPSVDAAPTPARMAEFTRAGYELTGGEYWPYVGAVDIKYPEEVLWGFYPEKGVVAPGETEPNVDSATPAAIACAERAYAELVEFITSDPPLLRRISADAEGAGYNPRFYLWTNDYSRAAEPYPPGVRPARLWYWKRKEAKPDRPPGFWKWESTLDQKGVCHTPDRAEADVYLARTAAELDALAQVVPACRGRSLDGDALGGGCPGPRSLPEPIAGELTVTAARAIAVAGKPWKATLTVTNTKALPRTFHFELWPPPALTLPDGSPLPGRAGCGLGHGRGGGGPGTYALDGHGTLTLSDTGPTSYQDCAGKQRRLAPGVYALSWTTKLGEVRTELEVRKR